MKSQRKGLLVLLTASLSSVAFLLLRFVKISPILGSSFSFFSLSDLVMPLSGNVGLGFVGLIVAVRVCFKTLLWRTPLTALVYHIPGICASGYWAFENKIISLIIPLLCIAAFIVHPVGLQAIPYSLYWLIPTALYFVKEKSVLMHSLASTFIAHSVGSVIFLYTTPTLPALWIGLIPIVAIERLAFAAGMTVVYKTAVYCKSVFGQVALPNQAELGQVMQ